jgi:cell shape-determining protein MreD
MRGATVLFLTLYLLQAVVSEVNSALSWAHIWLFAGGLFVAYSALMLPFRQGFAVSVLGGLLCDSAAPVAFGTHAALFATAHVAIYNVRERLQRDETAVRVIVALILNLALYLALSFARIRHVPAGATVWPRLLADLAWSELALALAAPWFFALQIRTLELARADPARTA